MAFTSTSKFIQLTSYLLMEYRYADEPTPETYFTNTGNNTVTYSKLVNGYIDDSIQIFNPPTNHTITKNTNENNVVKISTNSFVSLDSNFIIPFNSYSDKLTPSIDLPIIFPSNLNVVYDSIRYHIRAGYNLNNIDGLILSVDYLDQTNSYVTVSQIRLKRGTNQEYSLNPGPIMIGSNIYDKYFEIKIPNLKNMSDKYEIASDVFKPSTLAGKISNDNKGFITGSPMKVTVWQIENTREFEGYERYDCSNIAILSLEQEDPFSNIGATIKESDRGDFYEFFATDNEGFVEDFILFQNSIGNSYYIHHQVQIFEQIGAAIIETSRFESIQTSAYDTPNLYRPIIKNASVAASFNLKYTMSLVNSKDQSRVTRISSFTSNTPSKWGINIMPLTLKSLPQAQKIYNKILASPQINVSNYNQPRIREVIKNSNIFIQENYINCSVDNLSYSDNKLQSPNGPVSVAQGKGKLKISISPFDNYYKFKFIKAENNGITSTLDLVDNNNYELVFIDNQGGKIKISSMEDNNIATSINGEIAFRIDEPNATKIMQFEDRRFFISTRPNNVNSDDGSSVVFWSYWKKDGEADETEIKTIVTVDESIKTEPEIKQEEIEVSGNTKSMISQIKPVADAGTVKNNTPTPTIIPSGLKGTALVSAIKAEIVAYNATGWTDANIVSYFLAKGSPGNLKYPNITKGILIKAGKGILSPGFIIKTLSSPFGDTNSTFFNKFKKF